METNINEIEPKELVVWKKPLSIAIRIAVSAVILYFIISLVEWHNVLTAYQAADSQFILFGGLLLLANIGVRILKWRLMLNSVKSAPTFKEAFGSVMLGISLGSFTPGEIGEFAGRALHITDAKRSHLVGLALLDKSQIFIVTSAAGAVSLALLTFNNFILVITSSCAVIALALYFLIRMDLLASAGHRLNASLFRKTWMTRILDGFTLLKPKQLYTTLFYTITFHCVLVLQMFFFINAFSRIILTHAFIGTSAMMFVKSLLPISLGDLGIREAGSIFFFAPYDIPQAAALNAALLLFVINVLLPGIIGTYFLRHQQLSAPKLIQFLKRNITTTG